MSELETYFQRLTGLDRAHDWQRDLALDAPSRSRLIRIPTGMGKTLGVLAAWAWNRLERGDEAWPRRLVWNLPMRVLVEQTEAVVRECLDRIGALWIPGTDHAGRVGVHLLMGGTDPGGDWNLFPEESAVLIGTQDMLLSRALNRGYASGRARWPLEFGLLSHDALWIMDEVQLMDVGLATSAQLQAFHDEDAPKGMRPRHTWWMSATLQPSWLRSVDTDDRMQAWTASPVEVPAAQRSTALGGAIKVARTAGVAADAARDFADLVEAQHGKLEAGAHGRITLVVCNTVKRAVATFDALRTALPKQEIELVHSRFRPAERESWRDRFLCREACKPLSNRIIVATQVVEAGVDISAGCVVTDLAPWPNLVQRFGRCARYGGTGTIVVIDRGRDERDVLPYQESELSAAWGALEDLGAHDDRGADVSLTSLEAFEADLRDEARAALYPYEPAFLLLRRELDELFDTSPDLTGADLDISRFIRSGEDRDALVIWLDVPKATKTERPTPPSKHLPARREICAVPFLDVRDWLCGEETKNNRKPRLRPGMRAWVWDWIDGRWIIADRVTITPGRLLCVAADSGGYRPDRGFDPKSSNVVASVTPLAVAGGATAADHADAAEDDEPLSAVPPRRQDEPPPWKTIACHGAEVASLVGELARALRLPAAQARILALAGLWHDLGKAHPLFQGVIRSRSSVPRPDRQDLAKAPRDAWLPARQMYRTADGREVRRGFRHELASALALFAVLKRNDPKHPALLGPWSEALQLTGKAVGATRVDARPTPCEEAILACSAEDFDLLAYLVACHHGKVRVALHAGPKDQDYEDRDGRGLPIRGVRAGDVLPSVSLDGASAALPELALSLEPATLGLSPETGRSWRERTAGLQSRFGPGALAWLEALIIAADRRASRLVTADPVFALRGKQS